MISKTKKEEVKKKLQEKKNKANNGKLIKK